MTEAGKILARVAQLTFERDSVQPDALVADYPGGCLIIRDNLIVEYEMMNDGYRVPVAEWDLVLLKEY